MRERQTTPESNAADAPAAEAPAGDVPAGEAPAGGGSAGGPAADGARAADGPGGISASVPAELGSADASELAALAASASDEQLAAVMADAELRERALSEVFKRMADQVNPAGLDGVDAVVHFRITEHPEGGEDHYEAILRDGTAVVSAEPSEQPQVTVIASGPSFLQLVSGRQSGPVMFMTGKIRIEGDLMLASRMTGFFRIPGRD